MRRFAVAGAAFLVSLTLVGCATITRGTSQVVAITTPAVPGATCTLTSASIATQTAVTPATATLQKGREHIAVHCSKECYQDGTGIIASSMEGMAAGNLLLGGVVGLGVDAASGAMNSYALKCRSSWRRLRAAGPEVRRPRADKIPNRV